MFADGCLSHLTGVAAGLLGVYLRWLLYPHKQQLNNQVKMEMKQYQDPNRSAKRFTIVTTLDFYAAHTP